jgi:hypothetical protein
MSASPGFIMSDCVPDGVFHPISAFKCVGPARFRTQTARDAARLFDVDLGIASWSCQSFPLLIREPPHYPDFSLVTADGETVHVDVFDRKDILSPEEVSISFKSGNSYRVVTHGDLGNSHRLQNARDLLRYANHRTPLGDRVLLLRILEEHGSLALSECLTVFRETRPMAGLASLILNGFVEVDLDQALLGPETLVRRIRN